MHNRQLSLHILCITAHYFMPCRSNITSMIDVNSSSDCHW